LCIFQKRAFSLPLSAKADNDPQSTIENAMLETILSFMKLAGVMTNIIECPVATRAKPGREYLAHSSLRLK
jgi:hypothetical protein